MIIGLHPVIFAAWAGCILAALLCILYGIYWFWKSKRKSLREKGGR